MQCQNCGRDYPGKLSLCIHCGQRAARQTQNPSQSQLLEFPFKQRMAEAKEPSKPSLPAWRVELNEKVRARKAQKEASKISEYSSRMEGIADSGSLSLHKESHNLSGVPNQALGFAKALDHSSDPYPQDEQPLNDKQATNHRIVENALSRVKRASENAMRASLPRIEPVRSSQATTSLAHDREATARVLEPPIISPVEPPVVLPQPVIQETLIQPRVQREIVSQVPTLTFEAVEIPIKECESVKRLDEDHLLDYLEAEVEKVDRELHKKMGITECPDLYTHVLINVIDVMVIGLSCVPFLALIQFFTGNLFESGALISALLIGTLVSTFYLTITQILCGKTFGMMAANSHIVDALNNQQPNLQMILMRTFGYFLAAIPAFAGFFWITLDPQSRGWHDKISGTMVVRDY
jgi:uncharacterized RDD family membrane protein YckC